MVVYNRRKRKDFREGRITMYTQKEVMEYLQEGMLSEPYGDNLRYNVFLDEEGRLPSDIENADESFFAIYTGSEDSNFKFESPDNPAFVSTVKELTDKVNEYLNERLALVSFVYNGEAAKRKNGDCDIFFDVLPENETLERAMEKADIAWESLHWRDKRKQRLSLCIVDKDTEEILESLKDYE